MEVLGKVNLWTIFSSTEEGLDAEFKPSNLSQGQLQLFALARAILQQKSQGTRVILLDEAMSSIDRETEKVMRDILKKEFEGCTVVNVTHKIDTILEADVVVVMDGGEIVEVGIPGELMEKRDSRLRALLGHHDG
jgi:ATP-binding cassette subfamily C (CFTR/MRP) protein 1